MRRSRNNKRIGKVNSYLNHNSQESNRKKYSSSHSYQRVNESEQNLGSKEQDPELIEINKFIVSGSKLLREKTDTIPYLIEPLFPQTGVVGIVGSSDTGKSSFLRQLATAIVLDAPDFLGFRINSRSKRVIYVSSEDDETIMGHLLAKQNPNNVTFNIYDKLGFIFDTSNLLKKLAQALKRVQTDCVIIDAFPDLFPGDINQTTKVRNFLNEFSNLAVKYKCLFIFLHHTGKRTEDSTPSKNNSIGSQGFEAKMRLVIELRKDFNDTTIRHMCIVKGNYLPTEYKESSYVLRFDENMCFSNLNRRVPFDKLGKPVVTRNIAKEKAIEFKLAGNSINQVMELLRAEGYTFGRSTVAGWISNVEPNPVLYGYESDEPEIESEE